MIVQILSRILLFFSSLGPPHMDPSGSISIASPSNLTFDSLFHENENDTVILENPFFGYGFPSEFDLEADGKIEPTSLIKLPVCCTSIIPSSDGSGGSGTCSDPDYLDDEPSSSSRILKWRSNYLDLSNSVSRLLDYKDKTKTTGDWYPAAHLFPSVNQSHYRFEVKMPSCSTLRTIKLSMDEFDVDSVGGQGRFLVNGYFGFDNKEFFSPLEYCINGLTGEFVQVMICDSPSPPSSTSGVFNLCPSSSEGDDDADARRPCIQKCCNPDEIYSFTRRECIKSKSSFFTPIFYRDLSHRLSDSQLEAIHPHYQISFPRSFKYQCETNRTVILPGGEEFAQYLSNFTNKKFYAAHFKVREDGRIMYRKDGKAIVPPKGSPIYLKDNSRKCYTLKSTSHYCIDGAAEYGSPNPFHNGEGEIFLVTCSEYLEAPLEIGPLSFVYGNVMITSSIFSLLTVVVYVVLKEKQNIHGWTIASYAFSMFLMYIFLGLAHLIRYYGSDDVLKTPSCVTIGIGSHLFSLSSFFWLFLMNFDIWWTFRKFRPTTTARNNGGISLERRRQLQRFLTYSLFGWGVPIFITGGISTFLHFKYEESSEDECAVSPFPLPGYGRESCEIKQFSLGVYLYFPAALLLILNLLFFTVTAYRLCRHSKQTQLATKNLERHRQSVQLFAKLFFVMGVTRVFEVITWAGSGPTLTWYWAVFDIFNVLQAVAIFIIYVCKKDILELLKRKLFRLPSCFGREQPTPSSSSHNILSGQTPALDGLKK